MIIAETVVKIYEYRVGLYKIYDKYESSSEISIYMQIDIHISSEIMNKKIIFYCPMEFIWCKHATQLLSKFLLKYIQCSNFAL